MKKSYIYFLVPLIGLIAFGAVYWNFSAGYEAELAEKARIQREAKEEKLRDEAKNREKAIKDCLVLFNHWLKVHTVRNNSRCHVREDFIQEAMRRISPSSSVFFRCISIGILLDAVIAVAAREQSLPRQRDRDATCVDRYPATPPMLCDVCCCARTTGGI